MVPVWRWVACCKVTNIICRNVCYWLWITIVLKKQSYLLSFPKPDAMLSCQCCLISFAEEWTYSLLREIYSVENFKAFLKR